MDAVQAALFIPADKTDELIAKIAALGGSHQAELLKSNLVRFNTRKHSNHVIFYSVQAIENALQAKKKLSFRYFDLNEILEKVYRMDGNRYMTEPVALIYDDNNYYMTSYSVKYRHLVNFRVDRMDQVRVEEEALSDEAQAQIGKSAEMVEKAFRMFRGEQRVVTLRFQDNMIGILYDKFGEELQIDRITTNICEATVTVQISPPFWSWLFMLSGDLRLTGPDDLVEEYKTQLQIALNNSNEV